MVMNENHKFIITDTSFTKHPTSFQLKEIAKSAARIAKIFGWKPRVAMTSFATFGKPRLMNSKNVEEAVKLMDKDESINFE
jgi:malate dehydrogenase (oxaloacetate-decarboxylating)(NADP+)